jgi:hypothetical protein
MNDPFRLRRFEIAQDEGRAYAAAVSELRVGRKVSHWMSFVFPQISGLGQSLMSRTYAITSLAEAEAYLQHPVLGSRLIECTHILTEVTVSQAGFDHGLRRSRSGSDRPSSESDRRLATRFRSRSKHKSDRAQVGGCTPHDPEPRPTPQAGAEHATGRSDRRAGQTVRLWRDLRRRRPLRRG